jgi:hypothetical protein
MSETAPELSEEEIVEALAEALSGLGLVASSQDTGGDMNCVVLEHKDGGEIVWGTADVNWGAAISDAEGEYVSAIQTTCPSDTQDISAIARAIFEPSIQNGAIVSQNQS